MAVPTYPSAITLDHIQTEFGGSNPISLNEYYSGGSYVGSGIANATGTVIPTSGAINFLNFSGAVSYVVDPTQPAVTQTYWHGTMNQSLYPYYMTITRTGHLNFVDSGSYTVMVSIDGSGDMVFANTANTGHLTVNKVAVSHKNPYYIYYTYWNSVDRTMFTKASNTGVPIMTSNINWGANTGAYPWSLAPTSGANSACTALFAVVSNTTSQTDVFTGIVKIRGSDLTTIEWAKTIRWGTNANSNIRPYYCWTNGDESELYVYGQRGGGASSNAAFLVLSTADGATRQSWATRSDLNLPIRKATAANNIGVITGYTIQVKSNTGSNVIAMLTTSASWINYGYPIDMDYDSNIYLTAHFNLNTYAMVAKYNISGTRQWQIRIRPSNSANAVGIREIYASNTRFALLLEEFTWAYDGKKYYISGYGERRIFYLSSASGNTGTFGAFVFESNTTTIFGTTTNAATYTYTFSPENGAHFTLQSHATLTRTANTATFSKTAI